MDRRQREARQKKQDKAVIDHLTSGPLKPNMPTEPPAESAEARQRKRDKAVIDYLMSGSKPKPESTRDEQEERELREALFKRWTSAKGGGLAEF
jgi:hypothetical protein